MPRYYFHIRDGWTVIPDEEGLDFPSLALAEAEAHASAFDLAAALPDGQKAAACAIQIADEKGSVLRQIRVEPLNRFTRH